MFSIIEEKGLIMLNISFNPNVKYINNKSITFKGNVNFIIKDSFTKSVKVNDEFKHISDVLKSLGVEELKLGDNVDLARLLKSAMCRVKRLGFDVPKKIRCESEYFDNIRPRIHNLKNNDFIGGIVSWDSLNEPIVYLNTKIDWKKQAGINTISKDLRTIIWHETGHYLHMKNYKNSPFVYKMLDSIKLDDYQKNIVKNTIGNYAAENSVNETIAEIFARLMSGEDYNKLHPEVYYIYSKYNGPMPKKPVR